MNWEENMPDSKFGNNIRKGMPDKKISAGKGPVIQAVLDSPQGWSGIMHRIDWKYITGPTVLIEEPHSHDFEEFLIIQGNNPANPRDFDAEIELTLGEEGEKHIITGTTLICLPKGLVHGPVKFTRVGKPVVLVVYCMAPEYRRNPAKITKSIQPTGETKYGKYVIREPRGKDPSTTPKQVWGVSINDKIMANIGKMECNSNCMGITGAQMLADPPHNHTIDEILFLIPADYKDWPDLGGEMDIAIGEEWERQTINTAAVICLPKGTYHCPVYMRKVDKPFYWGHIVPEYSYGYTDPKIQLPGG
jgi:hypothetical protein